MASIRITDFKGIMPARTAEQLPAGAAQVAHNVVLRDGQLWPMPDWAMVQPASVALATLTSGRAERLYEILLGAGSIRFFGPPYGSVVVGNDVNGKLGMTGVGVSVDNFTAAPLELYAGASVSVSPALLSKKPVVRQYAVSAIASIGGVVHESALAIAAGGSATDVMYEGDNATIIAYAGYTATGIRIYRTTSDVTTGDAANGSLEANWQLVTELAGNQGTYVDSGSASQHPMDTYIYRGQQDPVMRAWHMGIFDGGWLWRVSPGGNIQLSEKLTWAEWPVENTYSLGESGPDMGPDTLPVGELLASTIVTGAVSVGDTLFIGTYAGAFIAVASSAASGNAKLEITPIVDAPPCLAYTMVSCPSGALYTSVRGVVSLSNSGATLVTRELAGGAMELQTPDGTVSFASATRAFYHNGKYYGLCVPIATVAPVQTGGGV